MLLDRDRRALRRDVMRNGMLPVLATALLVGCGSSDGVGPSPFQFELAHRGAGATTIDNLEADTLIVEMAGASDTTVAGRVVEQRVRLLGTGQYRGLRLGSRVASVDLTGVGSATVLVRDRLTASVSGTGSVFYMGSPPTVIANVSGTGRVAPAS